ncbi:hypothetical protein GCM10010425_45220 [Streptomyces spororaveus]|uniref:Uncharacterized protein n=1 Tax=Streptomyces spororaveus TaxID=284039 RepID=A0ABQ3T8X6_9ACTN|nr:hypothetical protein Sspor_24140 [Streptomyces spororaveus]
MAQELREVSGMGVDGVDRRPPAPALLRLRHRFAPVVPRWFVQSVLDNSPFIRNLPAMSAPGGPYKTTSGHRLLPAAATPSGRTTQPKGQTMNEFLSIAADVLAIFGASLTIALEVRRARREADRAGNGDESGKE